MLDQPPSNGGKRATRNRGGSAGRAGSGLYDGQTGANGGYWAGGGGSSTSPNYYGGGGYGTHYPIVNSPAFQTVLRNHTRGIRFIRYIVLLLSISLLFYITNLFVCAFFKNARAANACGVGDRTQRLHNKGDHAEEPRTYRCEARVLQPTSASSSHGQQHGALPGARSLIRMIID